MSIGEARGWPIVSGLLVVAWVALAIGESARGDVLVEAHRGYSAIAPENTVASINAASGVADLTEMDIHVTSDGALVLMHDSTVDRTTDGSGSVSSMTLAQIKTLDAGSWKGAEFAGEPVPTMAEAISACQTSGLIPLIERKAGSAQALHDVFVSLSLQPEDFRVISFDWNFLDGLDALNPAYNLGALSSGSLTQANIDSAKANGVDFLDWNHSGVTQATVDLVHANGMELHVWTVNGSSRMQELIDFGVDGITTDNPALLSDLLAEPPGLFGDLNLDTEITFEDWVLFNAGRGVDLSEKTMEEAYFMGDLDEDFDNDIADFLIFKALYEDANGAGSFAALQAVPEPATIALMLIGLFVMLTPRHQISCVPCTPKTEYRIY